MTLSVQRVEANGPQGQGQLGYIIRSGLKKKAKPERKYFSSNLRAKVVRLTLGIIISEIL